jgi:chromosome segregation protein
MDEVEPALDDVNLHRFLRLVREFATAAQVIIVTHQKRTMEVAQMMYGVSMGRDGTTKVVAQDLDGAAPGPAQGGERALVPAPNPVQ